MTGCRSGTGTRILHSLLPQAIARRIRNWGDEVYRISVKRVHWHYVSVRTKRIRHEPGPVPVAIPGAVAGFSAGRYAAGTGRWCAV